MMNDQGTYHSIFCAEHKDDLKKITAWSRAYSDFLAQAPERPGWAQKKADDEIDRPNTFIEAMLQEWFGPTGKPDSV